MIAVGFDPGGTTGWTAYEYGEEGQKDAKFLAYGQVKFLELIQSLESEPKIHPPKIVVIEDFSLLPHKARAMIGNKFEVIQAIGIIKSWANRNHANIIMQPASIKSTAEKWTQLSPKGLPHSETHWIDAANHVRHWLIKNGYDRTELEKKA